MVVKNSVDYASIAQTAFEPVVESVKYVGNVIVHGIKKEGLGLGVDNIVYFGVLALALRSVKVTYDHYQAGNYKWMCVSAAAGGMFAAYAVPNLLETWGSIIEDAHVYKYKTWPMYPEMRNSEYLCAAYCNAFACDDRRGQVVNTSPRCESVRPKWI